jgi:hypothetical protein
MTAQGGTSASGRGVRPAVSPGASTVGSHTIRAPSRAAISTASGLSPPTARFSATAPIASTSGTAARTTAARSAVGT